MTILIIAEAVHQASGRRLQVGGILPDDTPRAVLERLHQAGCIEDVDLDNLSRASAGALAALRLAGALNAKDEAKADFLALAGQAAHGAAPADLAGEEERLRGELAARLTNEETAARTALAEKLEKDEAAARTAMTDRLGKEETDLRAKMDERLKADETRLLAEQAERIANASPPGGEGGTDDKAGKAAKTDKPA